MSGLAEDVCEPGIANNTTCCWISFEISLEAFDQQAWFLGGHLRLKMAQTEFIIPLSLPNLLLPLHLSQSVVVIVQTRHLRTIPWLSLYSLYFFIHQIPSVLLNFSGPFTFLWFSCYNSGLAHKCLSLGMVTACWLVSPTPLLLSSKSVFHPIARVLLLK